MIMNIFNGTLLGVKKKKMGHAAGTVNFNNDPVMLEEFFKGINSNP
jgi:hypothetical protein